MELITQENIIQIPSPEVTENENPLSNIIMAPEDQSQPIAGTSNRIEDNHSDIRQVKTNIKFCKAPHIFFARTKDITSILNISGGQNPNLLSLRATE